MNDQKSTRLEISHYIHVCLFVYRVTKGDQGDQGEL